MMFDFFHPSQDITILHFWFKLCTLELKLPTMESNQVLSKTSVYQWLQSLHGLLGFVTEDSSVVVEAYSAKIL